MARSPQRGHDHLPVLGFRTRGGHGVLPDTDPDVLARLVDFVHSASAVHSGE
ncbi:MAG TPA: hypothetical protein VII16_13425 [Actinomycetes bacterium]